MHVAIVSPFDPFPGELMQATHAAINGSSKVAAEAAPHADAQADAHIGGVERVLGALATGLASRGHEVTLVCSSRDGAASHDFGGSHIVRRPRSRTVLRAPIAGLADALPDDVDIIHVPATYPFTTVPVLRAAHARNVPAVLDFHFEANPPGALVRLGARAYGLAVARDYRLVQLVFVRSHAYAQSARSLGRVDHTRLRVVPNGFDPASFHPDSSVQTRDDILFVGRLVPYKGLDVLLRALASMPKAPALRVAGDGPERARLENLAARLGVDVTFLGRVDDRALPDLYRAAQLTVLPSINSQEAFGMTLLESMACGTPVVASDLPGVSDVAAHGGLTAAPGDVHALSRAVAAALEPGRLPRGAALADPVHDIYTWDHVFDRVEQAYAEVLEPPRAPLVREA